MPTPVFSDLPPWSDAAVGSWKDRKEAKTGSIACDAGAWTGKGACRAVNEDCFTCASLGVRPDLAWVPLFLAIADGMGGRAAGERASRLALRSILGALGNIPIRRNERSPEEVLRDSLIRAHLELLEGGKRDARIAGMATTLTAALILWPRVHIVHAGDSRCYLLRHGLLRQLTKDHSVAEILVGRGQLSKEKVRTSPYRHILWNHLGGEDQMPVAEAAALDLEPGDTLVFATDGLYDALGEGELALIASRPCSAHAVSRMLVDAARARGARDDQTALVARFGPF